MAFLYRLFTSIPEFVTVLQDQQVKIGDKVILRCEVNVTYITVTWKKNGQKLEWLEGKYKIGLDGKICCLEIQKAEEADEGNYTVEVFNSLGSASCSAFITVEIKKWREIPSNSLEMLRSLRKNKDVTELHFLLYGPVGAGKSSTINTIKSVFERRLFVNCLAGDSGKRFTQHYKKFTVGSERSGYLPLAFYDVMGLEEGQTNGVLTDDIISALKGHVPNDYKFLSYALNKDNRYYITDPTLNDKIHCLVSVLPADKISIMAEAVIEKMKVVRREASDLGIRQMVFMTRVDMVCKMMKDDVSKVYQSKKIKKEMEMCSNRLGVPMNCIFPVKNYHKETQLNEDINHLMLDALTQIVMAANDFVERYSESQNFVEQF